MSSIPSLPRRPAIASVGVLLVSLIVVPTLGKSGDFSSRSCGRRPLTHQHGPLSVTASPEGHRLPFGDNSLGPKTRLSSDGVFWADNRSR